VWEAQQAERYEWIDGKIVPSGGVTFEHAAISSNLNAAFRAAVGAGPCFVQDSVRYLMPRNIHGEDLGLFRADVFVSCASGDKSRVGAHFPTIVVEILSKTMDLEFTDKKDAYLGSAQLRDYIIINSLKRIVYCFSWKNTEQGRRLVSCDYRRGPVEVPSLNLF
jgi:Uma2 family endonuclease